LHGVVWFVMVGLISLGGLGPSWARLLQLLTLSQAEGSQYLATGPIVHCLSG
jgi:hypothetical protein